jgi:MscS family membrane protein
MGSRAESRSGIRTTAPRRGLWGLAASALLLAASASAAAAQEASRPQVAPPGPADELQRQTPRSSVTSYLVAGREGDWSRAARYLNLDGVGDPEREGPALARRLKIVLDQELWVDVESLSDDPEGHAGDGLPANRDRVGAIETRRGPVDVLVERMERDRGAPVWKIAAATVAQIPPLYAEFGLGRLGDLLPPIFFESYGLEIQLWQWVGLLILVAVAFLGSWFVARGLLAVLRPAVARSETEIDDRVLRATLGPLRLVAALVIFSICTLSLGLSVPAQGFFSNVEKALGIAAVTWLVLRLVDVFGHVVERRLEERGQAAATSLVPLSRKTVKVALVALALLAALDTFGFDVTALIAGLGVGGLALALAAQKTLENLFGGATLVADRPVQVGDFCRFGDKIGTVEEIGLRSTRVRTLDRTVVTIPNAEFSSMQLENFAKRDKIWFHPRLGLRYETTPEQIRYVLVELRKMLYAHPRVASDPTRVRFVNFGDFSLDIDIYAYILATDYSEYLEVAEDVNLRIMDIVAASGSGFAFPSSTTYLAKDDGVDAEKTRAAEETVRQWRAREELFMPSFPPEKIAELDDTLDYPPKGSPQRD